MKSAAAAAFCFLFALPAFADEAAVARGEQVVEEWCRDCHLRAGDPPTENMAPAYEDIVARDGRDRAYLKKYLKDDHFPMTTFRLYDKEKADVLEWLESLKK